MHRRGGKRIRMDEPPPDFDEPPEPPYQSEPLNESWSSGGAGEGPSEEAHPEEETTGRGRGGRMTRLRARGGVPLKAPIIDEDDDDIFFGSRFEQQQQQKKRKAPRKPRGEGVPKEPREKKERVYHHDHEERVVVTDRESTTDESSLYFILRHSKSAITGIVDDWIESYKLDKDSALIALMNFFVHASGCKGKITPEMQQTMEHTAIIRKMTEEFDEDSHEYPLIMPGQQWKKFKMNFCDFVQTLVKQCQYSIIYDQFLMDNVISLLTGLSDSQVRAFRHTATLAAMKLMTALVDVALLVSVNFDNAARQYDAERLKPRDKRAPDRLESLMSKRTELEENMDEIKNMLTYMFKSVFVHRYRDTLPEIRAICMSEIGIWMQKFSQNFLDDSYLKYIGWTLHDKVGEVRLRCLQALLPLYENEELKGKLELFTSKFKDRIVAMTLDKEFEAAVHAVKLVINILKIHQDILTDKDCEIVYELVYSSHRGVAQAAAEFLNVRLFCLDADAQVTHTKRGKKRLPNTPLLRDLVQFFIESELHEHGAYLVDSFIDSNPMVKDWECMTDLLLEEPGQMEETLDNKQESTLIEIMVSAVRQAATGEPPVGRGSSRKMTLSAKEIKQVQDDKQKLTEHFIHTLPLLLNKYSADSEKLTNLLAIPQYFDLELYTTTRQEANLQTLLDKMTHIMSIHVDRDVLDTCSKTFEFLCTEGSAIYTRCDVARSNVIDECVNRYKEAIDDYRNLIAGEETPNEDEIYNVNISLKKVSILYSCHNLNPWNLFDSLYQDIEECLSENAGDNGIPHEALVYCIEACFFSIKWGLYYLENTMDRSAAKEVDELRENLKKYMDACNNLMSYEVAPIVEAAYMSICDLLVVFSDQLVSHPNEPIRQLVYIPSPEQQLLLNEFVQTNVFSPEQEEGHDETRIEELHKRRNFLAAYCKLIVYNVLPMKSASEIFKHYLRCYNEYGDIIKTTLGKTREINKVNCALTMCLSLINIFKDIQDASTGGRVSRNSQEFQDLKELAKRFALSFGLDAVKNREAITVFHRAGILFAVTIPNEAYEDPSAPPPCIAFLEVLAELTNKLIKQDKKLILSFMERRLNAGIPSSRSEDWQPLMTYKNSLLHGETDQLPVTSKRAYSRRKKDYDHDDDEEHDDEDDQDYVA
ncbi:cohesin subunit SA-1 [Wyeomyia smithii]|uniref:cohesin subunit SA-1 n=1 Tax=Wyeomyia smithii TaxID=174621 RepID=UPI002467CE30|nr:cohesin subunit SA-1 [Wyeomyia smithii]XP_055537218.1 cohesin subunit SA-1 [Wyeomyia smithii]